MKPNNAEFWNARFANDDYVFGTEASIFLKEQGHHIPSNARILVPADGEGRNSVYLAKQGHSVVATDLAGEGIAKARRLAQAQSADVDFQQVDIHDWEWPEAEYDAVVGIFIQFSPPALRGGVFAGMKRAAKPGGLVMLHGYTPKQLEYGTGGPPLVEHLYTETLLREAFDGWEVVRLEAYERELNEGAGHKGQSALIDLIVRRPVA